jgi:hypothetical protein
VTHRDVQEQVTVPERLIIDRQHRPVVAEPLQGWHHPGSQPVIAAILIQDACSLRTAPDLHRSDIDPRRSEVDVDGGDLRLVGQQADHIAGGPVIELIDADLRPGQVTISAAPCWISSPLRSMPAAPVDRPRLRTGRNLALLGGEGGQDLTLLPLGHLEIIQGAGQFRRDFVEHLR